MATKKRKASKEELFFRQYRLIQRRGWEILKNLQVPQDAVSRICSSDRFSGSAELWNARDFEDKLLNYILSAKLPDIVYK